MAAPDTLEESEIEAKGWAVEHSLPFLHTRPELGPVGRLGNFHGSGRDSEDDGGCESNTTVVDVEADPGQRKADIREEAGAIRIVSAAHAAGRHGLARHPR